MASHFPAARQVLEQAIAERAFPAATIEVGNSHQALWREAFGRLTFDAGTPAARDDTVFDLASLTKVLATTVLMAAGHATGRARHSVARRSGCRPYSRMAR